MKNLKKITSLILSALLLFCLSTSVLAAGPNSSDVETFSIPDAEVEVPYEMLTSGKTLMIVAPEGAEPYVTYADEYDQARTLKSGAPVFTLFVQNDRNNHTYYNWTLSVPWSHSQGELKYAHGTIYVTGYDSQSLISSKADGSNLVVGNLQYLSKDVPNGTKVTVGYKNITYTRVNGAGSIPNAAAPVVEQ